MQRIMKRRSSAFVFLALLVTFARSDEGSASRVRNVLFLISDDLRANALGCYSDRFCKTPNIDNFSLATAAQRAE